MPEGALPRSPTTTIRELLNEVRSEIGWSIAHDHTIKRSGQLWIEEHIEAALDLLDNALIEHFVSIGPHGWYRYVFDGEQQHSRDPVVGRDS